MSFAPRPGALALPLFLLAPLALPALPAAAQTFTWDDDTGDNLWFTDGNWDLAGAPNGAGDSAVVGAPAPTLLNGTATVDTLTVTAAGELTLQNSRDLALLGDVANDGVITLDGTNSVTEFRTIASLSLTGTGELVIGPNGASTGINVIGDNNNFGRTLTNGTSHTIRALGAGNLGRDLTNLVNAGTIVSDAGGSLLIDARNTLDNTGTLATANGGTLTLQGLTLDNTGGVIDATNGNLFLAGNVTLTGDSTVVGVLETTGTNTLENLTTAGSIRVTNGSDLVTGGILTNNGTITLDGTTSVTELRTTADTTLAGNGEVVIAAGGVSTGINIIGDNNNFGRTLTNGTSHTIRALGAGNLGRDLTNLVNDGLVVSDGGELTVDPRSTFTNNAALRAINGGTVRIAGGVFENSGSIDATDGTVVLNGGVTLRGTGSVAGTLETVGTNTLETLGTDADLRVTDGSDLITSGTITNNGTITLDGTTSVTELRTTADTTLAGNGEVVIAAGGASTGVNIIGDNNNFGRTLTNGTSHTIRALGPGNLGRDLTNLVNDGLVVSDGGELVIDPRTTFTNNGSVTAIDGGVINVAGGTFENAGVIDTSAGTLNLTGGVTLVGGGTFNGTVEAFGTNTLQDLSADADLRVTNGSDLLTSGTITNNGTITLDGLNAVTELRINADTTLAGTGAVVIGPDGGSSGVNIIGDNNNLGRTLTNGADHTIRALGTGNLGRDLTNLVNDGLVEGAGTTGTLVIDPRTLFSNNGTLRASGGMSVSLATGTYDNPGTIEALAGSTVRNDGGNIIQINAGDDSINGGTYRAIDGSLDLEPTVGFDLAILDGATLEFAGTSADTDLFAQTSSPGALVSNQFGTNAGTLILRDGADLTTNANGFDNAGILFVGAGSTFSSHQRHTRERAGQQLLHRRRRHDRRHGRQRLHRHPRPRQPAGHLRHHHRHRHPRHHWRPHAHRRLGPRRRGDRHRRQRRQRPAHDRRRPRAGRGAGGRPAVELRPHRR